jgi:hypothetical protein
MDIHVSVHPHASFYISLGSFFFKKKNSTREKKLQSSTVEKKLENSTPQVVALLPIAQPLKFQNFQWAALKLNCATLSSASWLWPIKF